MADSPLRRSVCPVACTLDLIGDRWTLLIVRDMLAGKSHYRQFAESPEGIATNILADRLRRLEAHGIVRASESSERAGSREYSLTPRGLALRPLLEALRDWGLANIKGTQARIDVPKGSDQGSAEATAEAPARRGSSRGTNPGTRRR